MEWKVVLSVLEMVVDFGSSYVAYGSIGNYRALPRKRFFSGRRLSVVAASHLPLEALWVGSPGRQLAYFLERLENLFAQARPDGLNGPRQIRYFRNRLKVREMYSQLTHCVEKVRGLLVLLLLRHLLQLLDGVHEHVEALQGGYRRLEVTLGVVELFYVLADYLDHAFGLVGLEGYVFDLGF